MPSAPPRYDGVQALRFVAAAVVVVTHSMFYTQERLDQGAAIWHGGEAGVDIFFVISGFVMMIASGMRQHEPGDWKYFSMRRIVRIVPMFWIALTVKIATMLVLPAAVLHAQLTPSTVVFSYLFIPNRNSEGRVEPLLGVGWTLTFEMMFYLIFAIALFVRVRPVVFAGLVLVGLAVGSIFRPPGDWPAWAVYFDPIVLYFLVGMLIALVVTKPAFRRLRYPVFGALVAILVVVALLPGADLSLDRGSPVRMLGVAAIVYGVVLLEPILTGRIPRQVLFLGDASYSLYLFHPLIAPIVPVVLARLGIISAPLSIVLAVAVAIIGGALVYRWIERPITGQLRRRLPYMTKPKAKPQPVSAH
ncbi:acyltransferase family protein [Plantibacter sp. Mn2098]|uniref:acyltransferase family protein n=1 Tax=Plantibacter sp. Mn2098 TaxID=3395266 RepID=UPI003BCAFC01